MIDEHDQRDDHRHADDDRDRPPHPQRREQPHPQRAHRPQGTRPGYGQTPLPTRPASAARLGLSTSTVRSRPAAFAAYSPRSAAASSARSLAGPSERDRDADRDRDPTGDERPQLASGLTSKSLGCPQRALATGVGQHDAEFLASEPHRDVGVTRQVAQQFAEPDQHLVAEIMAETIVDALEMVQVADKQRDVSAAGDRFGQPAPVAHAGQRVVGREVVQASALLDADLARGDLIGEQAHGAALVVGRQQPIARILDHDQPGQPVGAAEQRRHQAMVVPGQRPAAVARGRRTPVAAGASNSRSAFSR